MNVTVLCLVNVKTLLTTQPAQDRVRILSRLGAVPEHRALASKTVAVAAAVPCLIVCASNFQAQVSIWRLEPFGIVFGTFFSFLFFHTIFILGT